MHFISWILQQSPAQVLMSVLLPVSKQSQRAGVKVDLSCAAELSWAELSAAFPGGFQNAPTADAELDDANPVQTHLSVEETQRSRGGFAAGCCAGPDDPALCLFSASSTLLSLAKEIKRSFFRVGWGGISFFSCCRMRGSAAVGIRTRSGMARA